MMTKALSTNIEEKLSDMNIEELLNLEKKIMKIMKKKLKEEKSGDWRKDFLNISVWNHLNHEIKVDKWKIETF